MILKELILHNIGPFKDVKINFLNNSGNGNKIPTVIITGENGTGKSIVIDAIRSVLKAHHRIERDIVADRDDFKIRLSYFEGKGEEKSMISVKYANGSDSLYVEGNKLSEYFEAKKSIKSDWIIDYWSSQSSVDSFWIKSISALNTQGSMIGALDAVFRNADITNFITNVDYLRGSQDPKEAGIGEKLYSMISSIINDCIGTDKGQFKSVARRNLMPMVEMNGRYVSLDKLSTGNLLLLTHMIKTLYRMYCVCIQNDMKIDDLDKIGGVLLIDEIENHLHPKWQKKVLKIIKKYFPNLQLIITTHSPFVVTSATDSKIFVCKSATDYAFIEDETDDYTNLPIDEVLVTPVFNASPFNEEITDLLMKRKDAINKNNLNERRKIESDLIKLNETYFTFYKIGNQTIFYDNETH